MPDELSVVDSRSMMPPIATVSPSSTVTCVLTLRCEKDGESMLLPRSLTAADSESEPSHSG